MEVAGVEQAALALGDPVELRRPLAGGAVAVEAGVVEGHLTAAVLAVVEVVPERGGATVLEVAENARGVIAEAVVLSNVDDRDRVRFLSNRPRVDV